MTYILKTSQLLSPQKINNSDVGDEKNDKKSVKNGTFGILCVYVTWYFLLLMG
jgi:hypothetical protein